MTTAMPAAGTEHPLEIRSGPAVARFVREQRGVRPDWFVVDGEPLLRFNDHQWMSIGAVVKPTHAEAADEVEGGLRFSGEVSARGTTIAWSVSVIAAGDGWFEVDARIVPDETVGLVEALASFQTPDRYDGTEHGDTYIGGNPVTRWHGRERLSPASWTHPAWCYSRAEAARQTYDSHLPVLLHRVADADGGRMICTTVCADFDASDVHDLYVAPDATTDPDSTDYGDLKRADRRGYRVIVGGHNWLSTYEKDPELLVTPDGVRQRLLIRVSAGVPGGSVDRWMIDAWDKSFALHNDGTPLPVTAVHERLGVSWSAAGGWLQRAMIHPGSTEMVHPEKGCQDYVIGTRPKGDWVYGPGWRHYFRPNVLAGLRYRALALDQPEEAAALDELEARMVERRWVKLDPPRPHEIAVGRQVATLAPDSPIAAAMRDHGVDLDAVLAKEMADPERTLGTLVKQMRPLLPLIDGPLPRVWAEALARLNDGLDRTPWDYGYVPRRLAAITGGQSVPNSFLDTALMNGHAFAATGDRAYAEMARRFINTAIGWAFHTYNGSPVEDLDYRGLSHACLGGRDQMADIPPSENSHLLEALSYLDLIPAELHEPAWFDCLWLSARAALSQYPVSRTHKRLSRPDGSVVHLPIDAVASERDLRDRLPYMGYENPVDQTLVATYQSLHGINADLAYGGRLARVDHPGLLCFVPQAGRLDPAGLGSPAVAVHNPSAEAVSVSVDHPGGRADAVTLSPRETRWVAGD